ncbi:helix-turn-helix domain-containing protein [Flavobacterium sp. NST-5]|uniref:Helix-turn-helix domain-containing protein n=1 Tax=Flavobacterium ichthyis TaxID=2698827 RepID=A0ABW9ZA61_9FLAO|nr:AraC family transcriptional regulator [Flavobacterium ichthyis]NBL65604.1 helix-turn-helix domain-containing protein [Flavobacterium ichthyis]
METRREMFFYGCYPSVCRSNNVGSQFVLPRPEPIQLPILFHTCFICTNHSGFTNGLLTERLVFGTENIQHWVTLILNILSRNIVTNPKGNTKHNEEPLINKILTYIKQNIGNGELLKTKNLSQQFNLSQNYVGEYFKNLTGENLQQYVSLYKMKCIKQRLLYSDYPISQIADELGFTDESHLSTQFKKHTGINPTKFRQENTA